MKLVMSPQSSTTLFPMAKDGIVQISNVSGAPVGVNTIKVRWKVLYHVRGEMVEESGGNDSIHVP